VWWLVVLVLSGCGRLGFDTTDHAGAGDAGDAGDAGLPACNQATRLHDEFAGTTLDQAGLWAGSYTNGATMLAVAGGDAVITLEPNAADIYAAIRSTRGYDLRGERFIGEISQLAPSLSITGLQIDYASNVYASVSHYNGDLRAAYRVAGGPHTDAGMTPYIASQQRYFALSEQNGTLYYETSTDGVAFTAFAQIPDPFDVALVRLSAYGGTDTSLTAPGAARFARLGPPGGPVGAPCPASRIVDDFGAAVLDHAWLITNADACCTVAVSTGALTMTTNGSPGIGAVRGFAGMDLRDDAFQVELTQGPTSASVLASLRAQVDSQNYLELRVTLAETIVRVVINGTPMIMNEARDPQEVFLEIAESAGTIRFQVSKDASTWRDLFSTGAPFAVDDVMPILRIDTTFATAADTIRFDNFNVR
jgi:hypothetical protein